MDESFALLAYMSMYRDMAIKEFNTTGLCVPSKHYMVDISDKLRDIRAMVDAGRYFTINRSRQYGKTTTISALGRDLADEYEVISLDFQGISAQGFADESAFVRSFCRLLDQARYAGMIIPGAVSRRIEDFISSEKSTADLSDLFAMIRDWCTSSAKPLVLIIDEVDNASNYQVFMDFLAQLRYAYLGRESNGMPAFQSVVLAGVTDIRHIRNRIRPDEAHRINSPWNIAADFNIDMSLGEDGIRGMLDDYERDHHTGMDTAAIAREIRSFTEGYPFLVSRICQLIDTQMAGTGMLFDKLSAAWTVAGVSEAVRMMLIEKNTLFDSLVDKVYNNDELSAMLQRLLFGGERISYNPDILPVMEGEMYGFVTNRDGALAVSNRIFETRLYNMYLNIGETESDPVAQAAYDSRESFIVDGRLDMVRLLEHYALVFDDVYGDVPKTFDEEEGRRRFLLFLRPVINGTGNYYIEAQTRNRERMDLVIDYRGERSVIELKIWRGQAYHEKGEHQLAAYLDHYHLDAGYMLIYNFNISGQRGLVYNTVDGKSLAEIFV